MHRVLKCRTFGAFNLLTLKVAPDTDLGIFLMRKTVLFILLWGIFCSVIKADNFNGIIVHLPNESYMKFLFSDDPIISYTYSNQIEVKLKNGEIHKFKLSSLWGIEVVSDSIPSSTSIQNIKKNDISVVTKDDCIFIYGLKRNESINLFNLSGKHIYDVALNNKEDEVLIPQKKLEKGTYILQFSNGFSFKFIIK